MTTIFSLLLRLCLVAVKRFPENTYFPEMLISGKGKYFHVFGCISKNFLENIFWCLEKKKENTTQKKLKHSSSSSSRISRRRDLAKARSRSTARSRRCEIAIDGSSSRISRSSSTDLPLGSLAGARDRDQRRDLATARSWPLARSCDGEIAFVASPLARARALSLSLIFRKCFEGKIEV